MIGVKVVWRIKPGQEATFEKYWKRKARIRRRRGLTSEILFQPMPDEAFDFDTDDMSSPHGSFTTYVNIAYWRSWEDFYAQVGRYFTDKKQYFEYELRKRTIMRPVAVRRGRWPLPKATCK